MNDSSRFLRAVKVGENGEKLVDSLLRSVFNLDDCDIECLGEFYSVRGDREVINPDRRYRLEEGFIYVEVKTEQRPYFNADGFPAVYVDEKKLADYIYVASTDRIPFFLAVVEQWNPRRWSFDKEDDFDCEDPELEAAVPDESQEDDQDDPEEESDEESFPTVLMAPIKDLKVGGKSNIDGRSVLWISKIHFTDWTRLSVQLAESYYQAGSRARLDLLGRMINPDPLTWKDEDNIAMREAYSACCWGKPPFDKSDIR